MIKKGIIICFCIFFYFSSVFGNSGETLETSSGSFLTGAIIDVDEKALFKLSFQNPSYIHERDLEKTEYICDESRDQCKINFNLTNLDESKISSDFYCQINSDFLDSQIDKCNPNTILFPTGNNKINFSVFQKFNSSLIWSKELSIINNIVLEEENSDEIIEEPIISTGATEDVLKNALPEMLLTIQSGLDYSGTGSIYSCKKSECKINLDLSDSFSGVYLERDYLCKWDFGSGSFKTDGTDTKCNPGYVDLPIGIHDIYYSIIDKTDENNFIQEFITINNVLNIDDKEEELNEVESNTGSEINSSGSLDMSSMKIVLDIQSGLEYSGSGNIYTCKKKECKVNLDLTKSFDGTFIEKDFSCYWSFGSGATYSAGTDSKCNPGYVDYIFGDHNISYKIYSKIDSGNYLTGSIIVRNNLVETRQYSLGGSSGSSGLIQNEIVIQKGLDSSNNCNKDKCSVNLKFSGSSKYSCEWDFGSNITYREKYLYTCNPGVVYFYPGDHKVELKLYDKSNNLFDTKILSFRNTYLDEKLKNNNSPTSKITLQGKISKNKALSQDKIICSDVKDYCSINFTGSESYDPDDDNVEYFWAFGNGETSTRSNPGPIKYPIGNYDVSLEVRDELGAKSVSKFKIEVLKKGQLSSDEVDKNLKKYLQISGALVNNKGKDDFEYIELKNNSISRLNLKHLVVDDLVGKGSREYKITKDLYLGAFESIKLFKSETQISLNNGTDKVNILYNGELVDNISWNYQVPEDYIITKSDIELLEYSVKVLRVIDGDTLEIQFANGDIEKLRLTGVDTPETKHPHKEVEEYGVEAYLFTKDILEGKQVILKQEINNYRDKYNRLLGYIYFISDNTSEEINFNKYIIEQGYARAYLRFKFIYSRDFELAQKDAKKQKLGLWKDKYYFKYINKLKKEEATSEPIENKKHSSVYSFENLDFSKIKDSGLNNISLKIPKFWEPQEIYPQNELIITDSENKSSKKPKFRKNISKQKKSLKIHGETLSGSIVRVSFGDIVREIMTDTDGKYSYKFTDLKSGNYEILFELIDEETNEILLTKSSDIELSDEYISNLNSYKNSSISENTIVSKNTNLGILFTVSASNIGYTQIEYNDGYGFNFKLLYFLLFLLSFVLGNILFFRFNKIR